MSTESLNRLIKEVNSLTPQERRELIDRLALEEQNSPEQIAREPRIPETTAEYMALDFDDAARPSLNTHEDAADTATLREWLRDARSVREELPLTSDSVDVLRELREVNENNGSLC